MNVQTVLEELAVTLSDIACSGIKNVLPAVLQRLERLSESMEDSGMVRGAKLCAALRHEIQAYRLGESTIEKTAAALCALEFFEKSARHQCQQLQHIH